MPKIKQWSDHDTQTARELILQRLSHASHFRQLDTEPLGAAVAYMPDDKLMDWINTKLTPVGRASLLSALRMQRSRK